MSEVNNARRKKTKKEALLQDQKRTGKEKKGGHLQCLNDKAGAGFLVQVNPNPT